MKEIVKRIRQILEEQQLSSSVFADTIGVQRSSISHVLSGRNKPSLEFILKIIRAFPSYSTDWLLFGKHTNAPKPSLEQVEDSPKTVVQDMIFSSTSEETEATPTDPPLVSNTDRAIDKIVLLLKDGRFIEYHSKND
jgi:transcriptional regulator with XRE-family HTH domain